MASLESTSASATPLADMVYIGSGPEALIELHMVAWEAGHQAATEAEPPLEVLAEIERAAERACDEALNRYIPMDEARFCEVYILAWSAGYCSCQRATAKGSQKRGPVH